MMMRSSLVLSIAFLLSPYAYGVHANHIRYNNACLSNEQRGNPDAVDAVIFTRKPLINYDHVLATPQGLVTARKEVIEQWRTWVIDAITTRLAELQAQISTDVVNKNTDAVREAHARLSHHVQYLKQVTYMPLEQELVAVPEQDVVLLMQWADRIVVTGDEFVPVISIILDDNTALVASSCCGDLPVVLHDHMYWQKVIEAGWVAVDSDRLGRVQPILHTNIIGEKFHFYKTRYGVYFRETLGEQEPVPGDLLRIVKYVTHDPRHNTAIHGNAYILWLKFPSDPEFRASLDGQYIPNAGRAQTASWVYAHDLQALFAELNSNN